MICNAQVPQSYLFTTLELNGREIELTAIRNRSVAARSEFEQSTLSFLEQWLNGQEIFIQQTSGSTGNPTTISLTRSQLTASALRTLTALPVQAGQTALVCLDTRFIAGKMMLVRALVGNLRIVAVEPSSSPLASLSRPVDFTAWVPYQLHNTVRSEDELQRMQNIAVILIGGAPVPTTLANQLTTCTNHIYATYGMTETASHIALQRLSGPEPDRAFKPLPGITISTNKEKCLVISIPEMEREIITRDVAEIYADGSFRIVGRLDFMINSGGIKIFPEELELRIASVLENLGVNRAFFVGSTPHPTLGEQVTLFVEGNPLFAEDERTLQEALRKVLERHAVPRAIRYLPVFDRTPTGKIDRVSTRARVKV
jgi:O-succinylbenzoic acid--CoA ligase